MATFYGAPLSMRPGAGQPKAYPDARLLVHNGKIIGHGHKRGCTGQCNPARRDGCLENAGRLPASVYATSVLYTSYPRVRCAAAPFLLYGIRKVIVEEIRTFMGEEQLLRERG